MKGTTLDTLSQQLPEPEGSPLWQSMRAILQPISYLEELRDRYGDIFRMRASAFPNTVVLSHPHAIQTLFTANPNGFDMPITNQLLQPLLGSQSLILQNGTTHQNRRKLMMPSLHGQCLQAYGRTIQEITQQAIDEWQPNRPFSMYKAMQKVSSQVILRVIFGLEEDNRYQYLRQLLTDILDIFESPLRSLPLFLPQLQKDLGAWSPWGKFVRHKQKIYTFLSDVIRERRLQPEQKDILSLLLLARDEAGKAMSEDELKDQLITMLFAGHETTASSLAWAFYWLYSRLEVREKVLEELADLAPDAEPMEIMKLSYLHAFCCETLRIYPSVPFSPARSIKIPFEIMGYDIPIGTNVQPCIYLLHHHSDLYPEPKIFRPERFLERQFSPYEYIPFGGGHRRCLGYAFAQFEMKLVLVKILQQAHLELIQKHPAKPVRRGMIFAPSGGVKMVIR
ncbi:MAG: cytochrome P450 [Cyanobacteria bacterium P01_E01_bin.42]